MDVRGRRVALMFGGQGSQYYHMGKVLFENHRGFAEWLRRGEEVFRDLTGHSLLDTMFDRSRKKGDPFDQLACTHPAVFLVEYALGRLLLDEGVEPDAFVGYSLGEFAAAALAGLVSFESALRAIVRQVELIERHCDEAAMLAILDRASLFETARELFENCDIAALNFEGHFAVSGPTPAIARAERALCARQISAVILPVRYGFHSRWIEPLGRERGELGCDATSQTGSAPVLSCVTRAPVVGLDAAHVWRVARDPVRFSDTIAGLHPGEPTLYVDCTPSGTLATFAKNVTGTGRSVLTVAAMSPMGDDTRMWQQALELALAARAKKGSPPVGGPR